MYKIISWWWWLPSMSWCRPSMRWCRPSLVGLVGWGSMNGWSYCHMFNNFNGLQFDEKEELEELDECLEWLFGIECKKRAPYLWIWDCDWSVDMDWVRLWNVFFDVHWFLNCKKRRNKVSLLANDSSSIKSSKWSNQKLWSRFRE